MEYCAACANHPAPVIGRPWRPFPSSLTRARLHLFINPGRQAAIPLQLFFQAWRQTTIPFGQTRWQTLSMFGVVGRDHLAIVRLKVILSLPAIAVVVFGVLVVALGFTIAMAVALGQCRNGE